MGDLVSIPLNQLVLAADNVRRHGKADIEQLAADIKAHGLLQNLVVQPGTSAAARFEVVAGGRRLHALQLLARRKDMAKDEPIPCRVLPEGRAGLEASVAENFQRISQNAGEEAENFARLQAAGMDDVDISIRFGVTHRHVQQRLALAKLAAPVLDALKAGDITLDAARAFASVPDPARQAELYHEKRGDRWFMNSMDAIRRAMQKTGLASDTDVARFVGLAAYRAAGGTVVEDLFSDESDVLLTDKALLLALAREKLQNFADGRGALTGWGRVLVALDWQDMREQTEEMVEYAWDQDLPPDVKAGLVTIAMLDRDGAPEMLDLCWLLDSSTAVVADGEVAADVREVVADDEPAALPVPAPEEGGLPLVLAQALAMRRRDALALEIGAHTSESLGLFWLVELVVPLGGGRLYRQPVEGLAVGLSQLHEPMRADWDDWLSRALAAQRGRPDDRWRHLEGPVDRFMAWLDLSDGERAQWVGLAAGWLLRAAPACKLHEFLAAQMDFAEVPAALWRPTVENYFGKAGKARCLEMLRECLHGARDVANWAGWKKAKLADACAALAVGDVVPLGLLPADWTVLADAGRLWQPPEMRFRWAVERAAPLELPELAADGAPLADAAE